MGEDRFIYDRKTVNFDYYYVNPPVLAVSTSKKAIRQEQYAQCMWEHVAKGLGRFRKLPSNKPVKKEPLWECKPRLNCSMSIEKMFVTDILNDRLMWTSLSEMTRDGNLIVKYQGKIMQSEGFTNNPNAVLEEILSIKGHEVCSLWIDEDGDNLFFGTLRGEVWILPFKTKYKKGAAWVCMTCPNPKGAPTDFKCQIWCLVKHPSQDRFFWCCNHGISSCDTNFKTVSRGDGHRMRVNCIKVSPSGANLATTSFFDGAKIWDSSTLDLKHHLMPGKTIAQAIDWHPWTPGLLITGEFEDEGHIRVWQCNKKSPYVGEIFHEPCHIYTLKFHPTSGELVYAQFQGDVNNVREGPSTIVVVNGFGRVVDCSNQINGLVLHLYWGMSGSLLFASGASENLYKYRFTKILKRKRRSRPVSKLSLFQLR